MRYNVEISAGYDGVVAAVAIPRDIAAWRAAQERDRNRANHILATLPSTQAPAVATTAPVQIRLGA